MNLYPDTETTIYELAGTLRELRHIRNFTLAQVAERAQTSASYVSDIERGISVPSLAMMQRLCNALGAPLLLRVVPVDN